MKKIFLLAAILVLGTTNAFAGCGDIAGYDEKGHALYYDDCEPDVALVDTLTPFPEYFREQARQTASKTRIAANSWQTALSVIVDASVPTITPEPACSQTSKGEQI